MTTSPQTIAHLLDLLPGTTARAMFGEYALYLDGRMIASVCDDTLFVRPVKGALALLPEAVIPPPIRQGQCLCVQYRHDRAVVPPRAGICAFRPHSGQDHKA